MPRHFRRGAIFSFLLPSLVVGCGFETPDALFSEGPTVGASGRVPSSMKVGQFMPEATDLERTQALIGMLENTLENWRESDGKYGRSDSEREAARRKRATMLRQLQSLVSRGSNSGEGHDVIFFGEGQFITAKTVWFEAPEGATTTYSALFASNLATETDADGGECNPLEPV